MKNPKNLLIGALLVTVLAMSIGYAALAQTLNINGTAQITSDWNIAFTNITEGTAVNSATNASVPSITGTTATFDVNFESPEDSMTYVVTVTNNGSLDATLDDIIVADTGSAAILYTVTGVSEGTVLAAGSTNTVTIKVEYDGTVEDQPSETTGSLSVTLNYVQKTA